MALRWCTVPPTVEVVAPTVPEASRSLEPEGPDAAAVGAPFDPCTTVSLMTLTG
jgi:hypothetical protein